MNYVGNRIAIIVLVISALAVLSACGGESNPAESALVQLTVVPSSMQVAAGGSFQFSISVLPATASNTVTWSVSGAGCSTASCGAIDASGRYLAPALAPVPPTITIAATSTVDPTKSGTASVTIGPSTSSAGTFTLTGDMTMARAEHTATLLLDGRVLITGGDAAGSAELYNPVTGTFSATGKMLVSRAKDAATLLPDGKVLIIGPDTSSGAELFDPTAGAFVSTGGMLVQQTIETATLLASGKVLVAGSADAELYDPVTGSFTEAGAYAFPYHGLVSTATLLSDGRVLFIAGGPSELYDSATDTFSASGSFQYIDVYSNGVSGYSATLLSNAKVLIAGGDGIGANDYGPVAFTEVYDPDTGTFTPTPDMYEYRSSQTATLLPNGLVLIAGGHGCNIDCDLVITLADAELYNPTTGTSAVAGTMNSRRVFHQATLLKTGDVLITGGFDGVNLASAELYHPLSSASAPTRKSAP